MIRGVLALGLVLGLTGTSLGNPLSASGGGLGINPNSGVAVTDNAVIRGDGTTAIQGSLCSIDDTGAVTCASTITSGCDPVTAGNCGAYITADQANPTSTKPAGTEGRIHVFDPGTGKLPYWQDPTLNPPGYPMVFGTALPLDDQVLIGSASGPASPATIPDCPTGLLHYSQGTNQFQCDTAISTVALTEEFLTGPLLNQAPGIGPLALTLSSITAGCTTSHTAATSFNRPGIYRITSDATIAHGCVLYSDRAGGIASIFGATTNIGWTMEWEDALIATANMQWFGGMGDTLAAPPANIIGFRYINGTDTNFMCLSCNGAGSCTATATSPVVAADTAMHRFKMEMSVSGTLKCTIDVSNTITQTGTMPAGATVMVPLWSIANGNGSTQSVDFDVATLRIPVTR